MDYSPCCKMVNPMKNCPFHPLPLSHLFVVDEFSFKTDLAFKDKQIDLHIAQFDQQHLNDKLFDITNVYFPTAITHSIDKRKAEYFAGRYLVAQRLQQLGFAHQRLEANADEIELMVKFEMIHSEAVTLLFSAKVAIYQVLARFVTNDLDFGSATLFVIVKSVLSLRLLQHNSQHRE